MDISFRFLQGGTEKSLGSAVTNEKGKVTIEIPEDIYNTGGDKGVYSFDASFSGKDNYDKALGTTAMRPLRMELSFSQKEGQKMATLKAFEQGPDNQWIPVEKLDVVFYVPRTFSLLKVGQAAIENGSASMEFPVTVPGNWPWRYECTPVDGLHTHRVAFPRVVSLHVCYFHRIQNTTFRQIITIINNNY
jgi:hypothetical protein